MARGKIAHAYLFTGIPGIGKTSTAKALAMALNCRESVNSDSCGVCKPCRQIIGGNYPDFFSIEPEGQNIRISQMRDLNRRLSFAPVSGRYRVVVIYRAETMTKEAANSLLKTLEEPPPGNILVLNATEPLDILPTIVSRCQRVPFQPLSIQEITGWLAKKKNVNGETVKVLAKICAGSLGSALKMCEGDFLEKRREWLSRLMKLPDLSKEEAFEMAVECLGEDKSTGLDISDSREAGMPNMLDIWETWYRDLLLLSIGGATHLLINTDFSQKLKDIAPSFETDNLIDGLLTIDQAQRDIRRMRNVALVIEHTVLSLQKFTNS